MSVDLRELLDRAADGTAGGSVDREALTRAIRRARRTRAAVTGAVVAVAVGAIATTAVAAGTSLHGAPAQPAVTSTAPPAPASTAAPTPQVLPSPDAAAAPGACGSVITADQLTNSHRGLAMSVFVAAVSGPQAYDPASIDVIATTTSATEKPVAAATSTGAAFLLRDDVVVARVDLARAEDDGVGATIDQDARAPRTTGSIAPASCSSGAPLPDGDYVLGAVEDVTGGFDPEQLLAGGEVVTLRDGERQDPCTVGLPTATDGWKRKVQPVALTHHHASKAYPEGWWLGIDVDETRLVPVSGASDGAPLEAMRGPSLVYLVDDRGAVVARTDHNDDTWIGFVHGGRIDGLGDERRIATCSGRDALPAGTYSAIAVLPFQPFAGGSRTMVATMGDVAMP